MHRIGSGIFSWCSVERQSGRYGAFFLAPSDFGETVQRPVHLDVQALGALRGRHVRIAVEIVESRPSGHAGDRFLEVFPGAPPPVGSVIELAVGRMILVDQSDIPVRDHPTRIGIGILPSDGRTHLWLDPRILYVLHDQTVAVLVEETTDPETPPSPLLQQPVEDGVIMNPDGTLQLRGAAFMASPVIRIVPEIEPLPGGGFRVAPPRLDAGKRLPAVPLPIDGSDLN